MLVVAHLTHWLIKKYLKNYFQNIFIPYAPGDGGGSIGSSLFFLSKKTISLMYIIYKILTRVLVLAMKQ